ncbi:MAG: hypothetical protein K0Q50_207 [Vampirovibrio sp.]|jgi:hypothetical protein|nr:hypothetical protein [Vampirovibrio sp.]
MDWLDEIRTALDEDFTLKRGDLYSHCTHLLAALDKAYEALRKIKATAENDTGVKYTFTGSGHERTHRIALEALEFNPKESSNESHS